MVRISAAAGLLAAFVFVTPASAVPIQYIFTGEASGTLGGTPFSGPLTVRASGDTADVTPSGSGFFNNVVNTTINVPGLGIVTVTGPDYVFVNQTDEKIGYGVTGIPNCCDIIQFVNAAYATYDLQGAIGPLPFPSDLSIGDWVDVPTSGGLMTLGGYRDNTFRATTGVPEPGTLVLLLSGLVGLGAVRRRRRA